MIHSVKFTCVIDTCAIHPLFVRDYLFWLAYYELFTPKWSSHIFDEWKRLLQEKGLNEEEIAKRIGRANAAFPDAMVTNYEKIIDGLTLPDPDDRHVMAAAIKTNANVIVTNNLKDFPEEYLKDFGLLAKTADDFITDIIDLNHEIAIKAFRSMVLARKNPAINDLEMLDCFRNNDLKNTANFLHALL
ncbi:MAG: PIN domain-containing protein [Cytophagales bacterium]|nr:PIN domain-containing protein [Cytophagales bacterium]